MKKLELNPQTKLVATAAVIGGLLLGGCGEQQSAQKLQTAPEASQLPPTNTDNPRLNSLNAYRKNILTRHRAKIAMGRCVAWPNGAGYITATLNPGIAPLKESQTNKSSKVEPSYIFAAPDINTVSGQIEMDGPTVKGWEAFLTIMPISFPGEPPESTSVRSLSAELVQDPNNGQAYYTDKQTGLPVLDTVIVNGPPDGSFDPHIAVNTCMALRDHHTIPGKVG